MGFPFYFGLSFLKVPEILNYVRTRIEGFSHKKGQWLLTGSQEAQLMRDDKEKKKGMIWEAAPGLNLRSGWRIEGLFTGVFNGGGLKIVDKSGLSGAESLKAKVQKINENNISESLCFLCFQMGQVAKISLIFFNCRPHPKLFPQLFHRGL